MGAVAAGAVAIQHLLHLIEGRPVDQGIVAPLALDAVQRHDPDVVVVSEYPVHGAARDGFAWPLGGPAGAQPGVLKDLGDRRDGVLAGSGQIEGELDEVGAVGIDADRGDFAAFDHF
ncbi:MAG TPA: hypothetical protein VGG98_07485 [Solirubrobacteraceae bacterium]